MPERTSRDEPISPPNEGATALYRFFNAADQLLYVGITKDTAVRWAYHRQYAASTWWPLAVSRSVEWFDVRQEAVDAELREIRTQAPLYNSGGAPSRLREQAPGERLCPQTNTSRFYEATNGGFTPAGRRWRNMDEAVAETLCEDIAAGRLGRGAALPSGVALVNRFGVSLHTIRRATRRMIEAGEIEARGTGSAVRYFVVASAPA